MKRYLVLLLTLGFLFSVMMPMAVFAEETDEQVGQVEQIEQEEQTEKPEQEEQDGLETKHEILFFTIDNKHIYEEMEKSYEQGYIPKVEDDKVIVVLPLLVNGKLKDDRLIAALQLGGMADSPFVYGNYQKEVLLADYIFKEGMETTACYLVYFEIPLIKGRYNGIYEIGINVQAQNISGELIQQSFPIFVTISDGKNHSSGGSVSVEKSSSQPILMIAKSSVEPVQPIAGEEFTIKAVLLNTSEKKYIQNILVNVSSNNPHLTLLNDSSSFYFDKIEKSECVTLELRYRADFEINDGKHDIHIDMKYDNPNAQSLSSSGKIEIAVRQPLKIQMNMSDVPENVSAGETIYLSFQVMNMGRSKAYNIRCEVNIPGFEPYNDAFIGNLEGGSAKNTDMSIFINKKPATESEADGYGYTSGTVELIYEDSKGEEFRECFETSTTISEPLIEITTEDVEVKQEHKAWWITAAVLGFIMAGILIYAIVNKINGNKG